MKVDKGEGTMKKRFLMISLSLIMMIFSCVNASITALSTNAITTEEAVGKSIKEVFADEGMARAVAVSIDEANGDVDFILTLDIIEGLEELDIIEFDEDILVKDIQGVGIFKNVKLLSIAGHELKALSDDIGELSQLESLIIYETAIVTLPESFGNLTALTELHICGCRQFSSLPSTLTQLTKLERLMIHEGKLTALPSDIGNLSLLEEMEVTFNQLTSLPFSLGQLKSLQNFDVTGNLLPSNLDEVLEELLPEDCCYCSCEQSKLVLKKNLLSNTIQYKKELSTLPLHSMVMVFGPCCVDEPSMAHKYMLDEIVDENNNPVNIDDYFNDQGVVKKDATLYASIRATGEEVFPNNSNNAITKRKIELNLKVTPYILSFDLNGAKGQVPNNQTLLEGDLATLVENPIQEGFDFIGWNTQSDGKGLTWDFDKTLMPNANVTLYAQWKEDKAPEVPGEEEKDNNDKEEENKEVPDDEILGETMTNDKEVGINQKKPTKTSDDTSVMIYAGVLIGAAIIILVILYLKKKRSK